MTGNKIIIVLAMILVSSCVPGRMVMQSPDTTPIAIAEPGLPNPLLTPGSIDPRVTQANIRSTICRKGGYTASVRPPVSYTEPLKFSDIKLYGYSDRRASHYELDHLISLELGGNPTDPRNLWPEPHNGQWNSYLKDKLENRLHDLVCSGQLSLAEAQQAIATDWIAAYKKYVGK